MKTQPSAAMIAATANVQAARTALTIVDAIDRKAALAAVAPTARKAALVAFRATRAEASNRKAALVALTAARAALRALRRFENPTALVLYRGPSLLDGAPIAVVAIVSNRNRKTGPMIQTYIQRSDVDPVTASRLGLDASNCGACPLRGRARPEATRGQSAERECYVLLGQGPTGIHKGLAKGIYPEARDAAHIAALGRGRLVRIGTYGDGAAAPAWIWEALLSEARAHTAYSHQFDVDGASASAALYMQSAGSEAEAREAWSKGRRTFRVVQSVGQIIKGSEIMCPASKEAGARVQCAECRLCGGANVKGKSIAIVDHGPLARARAKRRFVVTRNGAAIAA